MPYNYNLQSFKDAEPINTFVKMALAGPQNSGKTVSALRIATGIGGEIAFIDSENERAKKYSASFKFKHLNLQPPFASENYEAAILAAVEAGFPNIIVDSMSHEHEGPGGLLSQMEEYLDKKAGDDDKKREKYLMASLIKPKQARNRLIQFAIQRVKANIILCFRAKEKVVMKKEKWHNEQTGASGEKAVPTNIGLQPIGGEEFWYEMDIVAMLNEHSNGKPDWAQQASRINEFPSGELTKYLQGVQQFNEETGRRLREFNTPIPGGGFVLKTSKASATYRTTKEWTDAANGILSKCTTKAQFEAFNAANGAGLLAVKEADESAYESFMAGFLVRKEGVV